MSAPSKEEIAETVAESKAWIRKFGNEPRVATSIHAAIVALADENERLRAERAECLRLLGRASESLRQGDEIIRDEVEDADLDVGYGPLADEIDAMVAQFRSQP